MSTISYDPTKNSKDETTQDRAAGYLEIQQGEPPLQELDKKTLLHLLFWLVHTKEGVGFLEANKPGPEGPGDAVARENLRKVFVERFGILNQVLQDALIDGHFAATQWVEANSRMPHPKAAAAREEAEKVYQQKISFVLWMLWEDAMGHEFSMLW